MKNLDPLKVEIRGDDGRRKVVRLVEDPRGPLCKSLRSYLEDGDYVHIPEAKNWFESVALFLSVSLIVALGMYVTYLFTANVKPDIRVDATHPATVFDAHSDITAIDMHSESEQLLVGTLDGTASIFDANTETAIQLPHGGRITSVSWSNDASQYMAITSGCVALWDAKKIRPLVRMGANVNSGGGMHSLCFGKTGPRCALLYADRLNIFDVSELKDLCSYQLVDNHRIVRHAVFGPGDSKLVAATNQRVACLDVITGTTLWTRQLQVRGIAATDDTVAVYGDSSVTFFDWGGGTRNSGCASLSIRRKRPLPDFNQRIRAYLGLSRTQMGVPTCANPCRPPWYWHATKPASGRRLQRRIDQHPEFGHGN